MFCVRRQSPHKLLTAALAQRRSSAEVGDRVERSSSPREGGRRRQPIGQTVNSNYRDFFAEEDHFHLLRRFPLRWCCLSTSAPAASALTPGILRAFYIFHFCIDSGSL